MATSVSSKAPARKSPAKAKSTASTARKSTSVVKFDPSTLPATGSRQLRHGGDYKPHVKALSTFAKGNPVAMGHVKALIHLGWVKPGGKNDSSKSPAFTVADNAGLSASEWAVGEPAGPQIAANLRALAALGAPVPALQGLWGAYVGK